MRVELIVITLINIFMETSFGKVIGGTLQCLECPNSRKGEKNLENLIGGGFKWRGGKLVNPFLRMKYKFVLFMQRPRLVQHKN